MAGVAGFEPANAGIKTPCLTAWRHPTLPRLGVGRGTATRAYKPETPGKFLILENRRLRVKCPRASPVSAGTGGRPRLLPAGGGCPSPSAKRPAIHPDPQTEPAVLETQPLGQRPSPERRVAAVADTPASLPENPHPPVPIVADVGRAPGHGSSEEPVAHVLQGDIESEPTLEEAAEVADAPRPVSARAQAPIPRASREKKTRSSERGGGEEDAPLARDPPAHSQEPSPAGRRPHPQPAAHGEDPRRRLRRKGGNPRGRSAAGQEKEAEQPHGKGFHRSASGVMGKSLGESAVVRVPLVDARPESAGLVLVPRVPESQTVMERNRRRAVVLVSPAEEH